MEQRSTTELVNDVSNNGTNEDEANELAEENRENPKYRITVEPTIVVIYMTQTLSDSVLTDLYLKRTCEVMLEYNSTICNALGSNTQEGHEAESLVQPSAAQLLMWKLLLSSIIPAFLSFFLGPWSDTNGRKPIIVSSVGGTTFMFGLYTIMAYIPNLHPAFLLLGVIPLACFGGYVNLTSAVFCYASDMSTAENRSYRLPIVTGSLLLGTLIGLVVSPYIFAAAEVYELGYLAIFGTCTVLCFSVLIHVSLFVKDSVHVAKNASGFKGILNISQPISMIKTCLKPRKNSRRAIILLGTYCLATYEFIADGESQLTYLFTRLQFRWSLEQYMNYSSAYMASRTTGTVLGPWILINYLNIKDSVLTMFSFTVSATQAILMCIASTDQAYFLYISASIGLFHTLVNPLLRSIVSKAVPSKDIGKVFTLVASLEAMMPIAAAPAYVNLYNHFIPDFPGAPFIISATLYASAVVAVGAIEYIQKSKESVNIYGAK